MEHKTLRYATLNDVPAIMEIGEKLFRGSSYDNVPLDLNRVRQEIERFIIEDNKSFLLLVSYDGDKVVGALAAYAFTPLFSSTKIAVEPLLYLEPEYRKDHRGDDLLDAYEYWAKAVGCALAQVGLLESADQRLEKLYTRRGYKYAESVYYKKLT